MSVDLNQLTVDELYKLYGEPYLEAIRRFDRKPLQNGIRSHAVIPIWLGEASDTLTLPEARILLADFGKAFSPEVRFESRKPLSFTSDIWAAPSGISLLNAPFSMASSLLRMISLANKSMHWASYLLNGGFNGRARHGRFTEDGKPINRNPYRSWEDRFEDSVQKPRQVEGMPPIEPAEKDAFFSMLRSILLFRPESHPTAKQTLDCEWMVKWALPEYEKIRNS